MAGPNPLTAAPSALAEYLVLPCICLPIPLPSVLVPPATPLPLPSNPHHLTSYMKCVPLARCCWRTALYRSSGPAPSFLLGVAMWHPSDIQVT